MLSRALKWDPLGRVLMLGTDQRDLFVPELRRAIRDFVLEAGTVFDFGCGDGLTLSLAADALPCGTRLSFEDPNPDYVDRYRRFVESRGDLESWHRSRRRLRRDGRGRAASEDGTSRRGEHQSRLGAAHALLRRR